MFNQASAWHRLPLASSAWLGPIIKIQLLLYFAHGRAFTLLFQGLGECQRLASLQLVATTPDNHLAAGPDSTIFMASGWGAG